MEVKNSKPFCFYNKLEIKLGHKPTGLKTNKILSLKTIVWHYFGCIIKSAGTGKPVYIALRIYHKTPLPMTLNNINANVNSQQGCLDIVINSAGNFMVKILNVHGQFVRTVNKSLQQNTGNLSVMLDDLSTGTYVLNIFKDNSFIQSLHYNKH